MSYVIRDLIVLLLIYVIGQLVSTVYQERVGEYKDLNFLWLERNYVRYSLFTKVLSAVIIGPALEEVIFRLPLLAVRERVWLQLTVLFLISTLSFGFLHWKLGRNSISDREPDELREILQKDYSNRKISSMTVKHVLGLCSKVTRRALSHEKKSLQALNLVHMFQAGGFGFLLGLVAIYSGTALIGFLIHSLINATLYISD